MLLRLSIAAQVVLAACLAPGLVAQQTLLAEAPEAMASPAVVAAPPSAEPALRLGLTPCDWGLLGAAAALRYLDYQTTERAMADPAKFREVVLPQALVDHPAGLAAFEAATVGVNYWIYRELVRHGHRRLARVGQAINLTALGGTVAFNEYTLARYGP